MERAGFLALRQIGRDRTFPGEDQHSFLFISVSSNPSVKLGWSLEKLVPVSGWRAGFQPFWLKVALEDHRSFLTPSLRRYQL